MLNLKGFKGYFTKAEILLWSISLSVILVSFIAFDRESYLKLTASLLGITALIFIAKGNPIGQGLMIIFSILYGIISYSFAYYGEMITYLCMSMPMAVVSLITWLKNPYRGNRAEVKVNTIGWREIIILTVSTVAVTAAFYFILKYFNTANLLISTFSVTTSFVAAYLTFRRSPYFALAYATNDVVLIIMWILACFTDINYLSVVICFAAFFANDTYSFINWTKMKARQNLGK